MAVPTGTVTFLFSDLEGSTRLLERIGDRYAQVLHTYLTLLRRAAAAAGGYEFETQGDGLFVAFASAREALAAAVEAQRDLQAQTWPDDAPVRVRMALHTGTPALTGTRYVGIDLHRTARICQAGWGGQVLLSQATRDLVVDTLPHGVRLRDFGQYRLKDLRRPEHLYQAVIASLPSEFPPLRSLTPHRHNLPVQTTSFVGREREVQEVKAALTGARLVTLTGTGGSGKTRLAIQVAADVADMFPDGAWFADLAALSDPALVPQTLAVAVGVTEDPGRSLTETLVDALRDRHLLVLLDNCEHLLTACAELALALLRACPRVVVLTTSREPLDLPGEVTYPVPPLALPDPARTPSVEELARADAVRLFVERASLASPAFRLTPQNAQAVVHLCRRLDGIPLAIELAAARVNVLSVEQISIRLHDRFRLLAGRARTVPRHRTLRAAMDWSYDLLAGPERALLCRLSVFAGTFDLEAVEAVCGERADSWGTLDLLARLVQRSLVTSEEHGGEIRYRMLETIRQYAREHLQASGEEPAVLDRHSRWYLALAERAEPELRGPDQARWLSRLDRDHDNLRAALDWLTARGEHEATLRLAHGLWRFWFTKSYYREGRGRLEEALRRSLEADAALRAKALVGAGYLALNQEDYAAASRLLEESLAIGERLGDRRAIALALNWLGVVAWRLGEFGRAAALYEQGIGLAEAAGAEDVRTTLLNNTALLSASRGDFTLARALLEEALAIHRRKADKWGIANVAGNLAVMVFREGDPAAARAMVTESLQIFRELGDVRERASDLQLLGILAAERGQAARAARILGAVEAARDSVGAPFARIERALYDYERHVTMIREALGPDAFASAWAEGRAMGLGEAVEYALHDEPAASSVLDLTG